jgi:hypothetical protein
MPRWAGLSERRFGNYVTDYREPDLQTLVTLARVLGVTTDELLATLKKSEQIGNACWIRSKLRYARFRTWTLRLYRFRFVRC